MGKTVDWDSPHITPIAPGADPRRGGYYNSTPGFAPTWNGHRVPVGAMVQVVDPQYLRSKGWSGRVVSHMMFSDGYCGLSIVECTDTGGFLNLVVGRADQVEIKHCRIIT
ncbi:hypothetical protein AB0K21_21670 [Streptosporangium sp. NPDC049248]|uniref:hypothetical protein n=1 Tax=Streptosporangium sp. NPDC049248 TaxID=3155651 RepID=UPI0034438C43